MSEQKKPVIAGLIAAAGLSKRMGRNKALLQHPEGGSFVRFLVEVFRAAEIDPVVVTVPEPPEDKRTRSVLPFGVAAIPNQLPEAGLAGSIYSAMAAVPHAFGFVITPVDAPFASVRDVRALAEQLREHACAVLTYNGELGHPVAFRMERLHQLGQVRGGARGLIELGDIGQVKSRDKRVLANINDESDLRKWGIEITSPHGLRLASKGTSGEAGEF